MFTAKQIDNPLFAIEGNWVVDVPELSIKELIQRAGIDRRDLDHCDEAGLEFFQDALDRHTLTKFSFLTSDTDLYGDLFGAHELGLAQFKFPGLGKVTQALALQDFGFRLAGITHQLVFTAAYRETQRQYNIIQLGTLGPGCMAGGSAFTELSCYIGGLGSSARWERSLGFSELRKERDRWPQHEHDRILVIK